MKYKISLFSNPRIFLLFPLTVMLPVIGVLAFVYVTPIWGILITAFGILFGYSTIRYIVSQSKSWVEISDEGIKTRLYYNEIIFLAWKNVSLAGFCSAKKPFLFVYESERDKLLTIPEEFARFDQLTEEFKKHVSFQELCLEKNENFQDKVKEILKL